MTPDAAKRRKRKKLPAMTVEKAMDIFIKEFCYGEEDWPRRAWDPKSRRVLDAYLPDFLARIIKAASASSK